ncbi:zeaxanthin epoxidase, chloroplastic-like [Canna indica]|uniref:Zeaxanthin epoxidase, chloroplastic-like n=1 Tax=Canna indica TaxID=4628 RepID=A0AAQ3JUA2_9LILI|nr:zeaxanthin epoxidase, chloroplastic-like [Canna indica]
MPSSTNVYRTSATTERFLRAPAAADWQMEFPLGSRSRLPSSLWSLTRFPHRLKKVVHAPVLGLDVANLQARKQVAHAVKLPRVLQIGERWRCGGVSKHAGLHPQHVVVENKVELARQGVEVALHLRLPQANRIRGTAAADEYDRFIKGIRDRLKQLPAESVLGKASVARYMREARRDVQQLGGYRLSPPSEAGSGPGRVKGRGDELSCLRQELYGGIDVGDGLRLGLVDKENGSSNLSGRALSCRLTDKANDQLKKWFEDDDAMERAMGGEYVLSYR